MIWDRRNAMLWGVGVLWVGVATVASAQYTNHESDGNLEPTQNPGCIAVADANNSLTPADLSLGALEGISGADYDRAVDLFILLQVRAIFDSKRVTDVSAHAAGSALQTKVINELNLRQQAELNSAFGHFGGQGSARHRDMCQTMKASGAPKYRPDYMIRHGMNAFIGTEGEGLVAEFEPDAAWQAVLDGFFQCGE